MRAEFIRLKQLEKAVADYDFLSRDLQVGFDYNLTAVLKPVWGREDFDIVQMEWGFITSDLKTREEVYRFPNGYMDARGEFHKGLTTLNAMGEELLLPHKIYREAALKQRCLILSSGFYEWQHHYRLNKKTGKPLKTPDRKPHFIRVKDREYFYMAGIYQEWKDINSGELVETCAAITAPANTLMAEIHNSKKRMPAILDKDDAYEWMFSKLSEERITEIATAGFPLKRWRPGLLQKIS